MVFIGTTLKSVIKYFKKKAVSNLDDESRWTVHYTAPWHQQENVFLPGNRPACVEDLHRQAKVNLKTALRECDKLRKDGFRSSQYYSQGPIFSSSAGSHHSLQEDDDIDKRSTSASSADDEKIAYPSRPLTPLVGGGQDVSSVPLPTPEQKMRAQAQAVPADIIPINISGETFDRQASVRRSLVNTDTVVRRSKKVKRRKTITGVPDNVQKELGKGPREFRAQSMYIPGQFSTLGRVGSMNSSLRRSETRDSSCQTEEIKIVPPSVRRIRAQRGQGIAAQMAGLSASSSGNISAASLDGSSTGTAYAYASQLNGGGPRFHSLPRQGARVSLSAEPIYSSAPCRPEDYQASSKIAKLQADETVVHMRCAPKTATLSLPKSQPAERAVQGDPAPLLVSPHAAYSTSLIPNATLSSIAQVITLHTSGHAHSDQTIAAQPSAPPGADMGSQCSELDAPSESSCYSDGSFQNSAASTADQWVYDTPENVLPKRPLTSSCSTPINQLYGSLERPSNRADSDSLCSVDNDGFYTSMRLDSGLKSRSHGNIPAARHSMYECQQLPYASLEDRASLYSNRSLSRSISLRKSKKPPLPPARTDSLRRKPDKNVTSNGAALNKTLIASLQQSLVQGGLKVGMAGSSPSQSPCSDDEDPWVLRPRSQSSTSAGSSGMSANVYSLCPVTPPQSDTSSLRSDYAEWGCYTERPRSPIARSISVGGTPLGCQENRPQVPLPLPLPLTQDIPKPKAATTSSPDRLHRLTSPSSGYSSQSNTPTAGTPVPSFVKTRSPAGARPKPKVPERKSSLLSSMSISSSSTSLSSNTSDSARTPVLPPPFPSMNPAFSPPALPPPATPEVYKNPPPYVLSPVFPSPPPEVMVNAVHPDQSAVSPPPPPPPPPLPSSVPVVPQPPPLPPTAPPTSMPLDMRSLKEALKSAGPLDGSHTPNGVNHNPNGVNKPELNYTGSPVPLITAQALQMVQLRSVKKPESLENTEVTTIRAQEARNGQELPNFFIAEKTKKPAPPTVLPLQSCAAPAVNGTNQPPTPINMFHPDLPQNFIAETASEATANTDLCRNATLLVQAFSPSGPADEPSHPAQIDSQSSPAEVSFDIACSLTPKQKPPVATKKPKLSLLFSPIQTLPKTTPETPPKTPPQTPPLPTPSLQLKGQLCADVPLGSQNDAVILEPDCQVGADETESVTTSLRQSVESLSYSLSSQSLLATNDPAPSPAPAAQELPLSGDKNTSDGDRDEDGDTNEDKDSKEDRGAHGNGDRNEDKDSEGDQDADADGDGDTSEDKDSEGDQDAGVDADGYSDGGSSPRSSISPKNKESDGVFDPSTTNSSPAASTNGDDLEEMETPTRPRTTEDLFAAIHRSKRKVLGRRESEEDRSRSHSPSPPVTPTGMSPSSLPRPAGSIQRTMRKSATSSDSFKALLLRKGSRSETSFRMSATEMLRSTDPRFQRTRSESSLDSPLSPLAAPDSPGRGSRRAQEDWARCEGVLPRSLTSCTTPSKHGRPRAPPMAASSKYNARSRILSSPMTVIREGESELGEAADSGSQAAGPVDSTDTLCEESS